MKKHPTLSRIAIACLMTCSAGVLAANPTYTPGALSTLGKVSHPGTILSSTINPAAGELLVGMDEKVRMGFMSSLGYRLELGPIDNFLDQADDLADALEDEDLSLNDALELKDDFDALLPEFGQSGRLTQQAGFSIPLMPFAFRSETLNGVITFDISAGGMLDARFLDDPIQIEVASEQINLLTSSSFYIKSAAALTASVGYSRNVWESEMGDYNVYAGATANLHVIGLNKQLIALQNLIDDEDVGTAIEDEFSSNTGSTTEVGFDLGVLWTAPNAQIGLTILNANEPEFAYGDIGQNCLELDTVSLQSNCFIAQQVFSDEIALSETATLSAKTIVEGAIYTESRNWLISAAAELNSTYDLIGRESQYVSVSASYSSDGYILPSLRFGAAKNLVGTELTTVSGGTTLLGMINIDLTMSLETIEVDGSEIPRVFGFNIGIEEKF
ncbi:conjugal transfer protein TraF [Psychrosphaera sp. 1_MG-2023]|uniref:conjugal transfer protein TraF n=1 Tax=Psychrosphaera sp. 1_MG-2023 TaxID=3062643 RepID=UPI0026E12D2A|nr:conjugal transfer protein TraF [Psychrosphaera sp. 1_MG-2023]MDO6718890.1 conjugal transfer protein TraF [Psychrosphaera sp. 1_MG-2023]